MPSESTARGITVELGGDVSGIQKALGSINTEIRSTQNELKQVERLLKLDPSNTELLQQKQKLLSDAVQDTTLKLSGLQNAQKQAAEAALGGNEKAQEEYRKLQREVVETQKNLTNLEGQLKSTDKALEANSASAGGLTKSMQQLGQKFEDADQKLNGKLTKGVEAFGVAAVAAGGMALKAYSDFSGQMIKVRTLLDESVISYDAAKEAALAWSGATGQGADAVAEAMYNALSAGVQTTDIMGFMAQATQTATAGFTDASTSVDILTTILNAYGMEAQEVTNVSDKLLLTQDKGKVTVGQLASGLGNLVGVASSAGVSLEEVLSAVAALTAAGQAPSSAINSLKAAISNMIKPSGEAAEMASKLHFRFSAQSLAAQGLSGVMAELQEKTGGNTAKMAKLFGSVEALNAMLILCGEGNQNFTDTLNGMNDVSGKTAETFDLIASEPAFRFNQAMKQMSATIISLGQTLSPLLNAISSILSLLAKIDPAVLTTIIIVASLVSIAYKAFSIFKSGTGIFKTISSAVDGTSMSLFKLVGIITIIIAVVTALVYALVKLNEAIAKNKAMDLAKTANDALRLQNALNGKGSMPPHYATGTGYHMGGRALVGEYGPEIVELPKGSRVLTANHSQKVMAGGASVNETYYVTIDAKNVREFNDIVRMAKTARQQRRAR